MSLSLAACIIVGVVLILHPWGAHTVVWVIRGGCCCLPVSPPKPSSMFAGHGSAELRRLRSAACLDQASQNAAAACSFHEQAAHSAAAG
jgi:hypothetical protein